MIKQISTSTKNQTVNIAGITANGANTYHQEYVITPHNFKIIKINVATTNGIDEIVQPRRLFSIL